MQSKTIFEIGGGVVLIFYLDCQTILKTNIFCWAMSCCTSNIITQQVFELLARTYQSAMSSIKTDCE